MIVSIAEVRRSLGKKSEKYTDSQVEEAVGIATVLSDLFIDYFIERKKKEEKD